MREVTHAKEISGRYPAYVDSPDWVMVSLKDICSHIGDGIHATPVYAQYGEYYFINGNNIRDGRIVITNDTKSIDWAEFKKFRTSLGDRTVLLSINGTIGNLALFANEPVVLGKSAAYLNIKSDVDRRYFFYALQTQAVAKQFDDGLTGTTIRNLGLATIRATQIPIPPTLQEQRAIAEALWNVDELLEVLEALIAKKRGIKQATMQQLLTGKTRLPGFNGGWETKPLDELAYITMGQSPSSQFYNLRGDGLPLIQGNADIEDRRTIERVWTTQASKRCEAGALVLTVRAPVGTVGIASKAACLGRGVCGLEPLGDTQFLFHALVFAEPRWRNLEQGSTFTSANSRQVGQFALQIPHDEREQMAIANILSNMDAEITALEARVKKTRSLKQGMMQQLLTGRIRLIKPHPAEAEA